MFDVVKKIFESKLSGDQDSAKNPDLLKINQEIFLKMRELLDFLETTLSKSNIQDPVLFENIADSLKLFKISSLKFLTILNKENLVIQTKSDRLNSILENVEHEMDEYFGDFEEILAKTFKILDNLKLLDTDDVSEDEILNQILKFKEKKYESLIEVLKRECKSLVNSDEEIALGT